MAIKKPHVVEEEKVEEVKMERESGTYVTTSSVNFRVGPSYKDLVIRVLNGGEQVDVIEFKDDWAKCKYDKTIGYVMAEYLKAK